MNMGNVKWSPGNWQQAWTNEQGACVRCEHYPSEHWLVKGGDDVHRVFCINCPHPRIRLMGDQGTANPIPFFIEFPGTPSMCFEERQVSKRIDNFLPLSPSKPGEEPSKEASSVLRFGPEGEEEFVFTGIAWQVEEFEQLKHGDAADLNRYKLHLYWVQEGRCAGCKRYIHFDNMEVDRIIPGRDGPGYTVGNIQLLCPGCNKIKGDRCMEYLRKRRQKQGLL